ncbi:MAG TPA: hypothetical protein VHY09_00020 [Candidatus Methylacidiphilales bacterium]|jgi:hypothetical protein|nr:hypothetical protein [Candidatus Methylacidiphilales bacterium]
MPAPTELFRLVPVEAPWGDYGRILMHGMSMHLDRRQGLIQLERTGPSIAPITFPGGGDLVVTDAFKSALESSGLTGFDFQPVIKRHIVELDWEEWDITADEPQHYPDLGEPENYLLGQPHETRASDELGILWEMCLQEGCDVERTGTQVRLLPETWSGADFFYPRTMRLICVSGKARRWLVQHAGDYVEFRDLRT